MKLFGLPLLEKFKRKHADVRGSLDVWRAEVEAAEWKGPQDIKNRYASASFLGENRVIFNIKGNTYRLVIKVKYVKETVVIEWIGTHAEYDKQKFGAG
jgi:mRNA interferase HigB